MKVINLLPKLKQRELQFEITFRRLIRFTEISIISALIVFTGQLLIKVSLQQKVSSISREIQQTKTTSDKSDNVKLRDQVKQINAQISDFKKLQDTIPNWSNVLIAFASDVPNGVSINSFSATSDKRTVSILGFSSTREGVIELYNNILADKDHFADIDYPLENVTKPENIAFHFNFTINENVLKPQQ